MPRALRNSTGKNVAQGFDCNDTKPVNLQCDRPAKRGHRHYDPVVSLVANQDALDPLQSMIRDLDTPRNPESFRKCRRRESLGMPAAILPQ